MTQTQNEAGAAAPVALVIWAATDSGTRSVARTLSGLLAAEPHQLEAVELDLAEELAGQSLLSSLATWSGMRLERTLLSTRGWPVVEQRLAGRAVRVVLALDPVAAEAVDSWRSAGQLRAPLVGVATGLRVDPAWAKTAVDRLGVADETTAHSALALGLPAEVLVPCGIPVCGGFSSIPPDEKEGLRRRFGLGVEAPVVLVVAHGLEPDQLTGALFQLSLLADKVTLMFDVARDDDSADLLRRRAALYGVQARMFGKVEEAGQLWAASDVVVARHHIYAEQRAVALRLPYIHLLPEGEMARQTARIYVEREIGRLVGHISTLAAELELQLAPEAMATARERIARISRRTAATDVARLVAQVASEADRILAERYRRPAAPEAAEPAPDAGAAARSGPLEVIGAPPEQEAQGEHLLEDVAAAEAEANRQVTEHQRELEQWSRRAALAAEKHEPELQREAERLAERSQQAMHRALAELTRLTERRKELEARGPRRGADHLARTFQQMEVEQALAELKRKMKPE